MLRFARQGRQRALADRLAENLRAWWLPGNPQGIGGWARSICCGEISWVGRLLTGSTSQEKQEKEQGAECKEEELGLWSLKTWLLSRQAKGFISWLVFLCINEYNDLYHCRRIDTRWSEYVGQVLITLPYPVYRKGLTDVVRYLRLRPREAVNVELSASFRERNEWAPQS